jgi:hypothetical protein
VWLRRRAGAQRPKDLVLGLATDKTKAQPVGHG